MPSLPTKAPTFESTLPKHEAPKAIPPAPDTSTKAPPVTAPKTPRDGKRDPKNPGAVVYDSSKAGSMIRVSKILTRYHQELEVQEDEPGESLLLRSNPQG